MELSDRVIELRDGLGLTFKGIAELLISEGYRSPRGFDLGSESVFSIYNRYKRKATTSVINAETGVFPWKNAAHQIKLARQTQQSVIKI